MSGQLLIEILAITWTLLAVTGFGVNIFAVQDARLDRVTVETWAHVGTRTIVAKANMRREAIRSGKQFILCVAGVLTIFAPPPPDDIVPTRVILSITFMLITGGIVLNTVWDRHDRKRLLEEIVRQDEERLKNA